MNTTKQPTMLIIIGFALAAICWATIMFADPSDGLEVVAWIGQAFGIGLGSVGIGMRAALGQKHL